jgi:alpha-galactosidase
MKTNLSLGMVAALLLFASQSANAVTPTTSEMAQAEKWVNAKFSEAGKDKSLEGPFFSFTYDGKPSSDLLSKWELKRSQRKLDEHRTETTLAYSDPKTGLIVRCVGVAYSDFPTVEWTVYFKNAGDTDTPILENIQAIDARFVRPGEGPIALHTIKGDVTTIESYTPLTYDLAPKSLHHFLPQGGRPTQGEFPQYNIQRDGKGMIVVVGWPGRWSAKIQRDDADGLRVIAGQELTHFKLVPGEEVRSPLVVLQFYEGDWIRGQNLWRRWMVAHTMPRPDGKLIPTHYGACWSDPLYPKAESELAILNGYIREGIDLKYYFIDAGWYPGKTGNWWTDAGTWEVDKTRFPNGIREVSDLAHANGMDFVLWFEPERAGPGSWLAENKTEWIFGGKNGGIVDLGNPEAWKWIVERIDSLIKSEGVDVYRQDYNIDPLAYWRGADAPDRQGINEIKYLCGYLSYWDELMRRNPKLWIDSCASGGNRNDLETMRRSVPLLRSDFFGTPEGQQCLTYGLSLWIPYHGSGTIVPTKYWFRSTIFPASRVGWDTRKKDLDYGLLKNMIAEFHRVEPYLLSDFYPLTPHSPANNVWMAWQFDEPGQGGAVQAFRRAECEGETLTLKLQGLDPNAQYELENLDGGNIEKLSGKALMDTGLTVTLKECSSAALFIYRKAK